MDPATNRRDPFVEAHPRTLKFVFRSDVRLEVPLFQRRYVWNAAEQWEPLWEDVLATLARMQSEDAVPHFLGAIVLEQVRRPLGSVEVRQVIDGQQRLTTLQVLAAAVRDAATDHGGSTKTIKRLGNLLYNDDDLVDGDEDAFKLWPTNADRADFKAVLNGSIRESRPQVPDAARIARAYLWFRDAIDAWLVVARKADAGDALDRLAAVVIDGLEVVVIDLGPDDNAQVIFETLNARGTPLRAADLIKNLLFRTLQDAGRPIDRLYDEHWRPLEADIWQTEVRQGRLLRPRLDAFVGNYLVVLAQREVQAHQLFASLRAYVGRDARRAEQVLIELSRFAAVDNAITFREGATSRESESLGRLEIADTQTTQPVLLWLFANHSGVPREDAVRTIESYLVRRAVCRLTTKNYNNIFLEMLIRLVNGEGQQEPAAFIRDYLAGQGSDSGVWPSDADLEQSFRALPLYKVLKRKRLHTMLLALEEQARGPRSEAVLPRREFSLEHLLPQKWREHWPLTAEALDGDPDAEATRDTLLHTIGNLTLVTQPLNSALSNDAWPVKRAEIMRSSALTLNRSLPEDFDESAIRQRSVVLAQLAAAAWPRPPIDGSRSELIDELERDLRPDRDHETGTSAPTPSGSGQTGRRDIGRHIRHVFADVPVGTFLTINEIRLRPSPEYDAGPPSAGAIAARLFPASGRTTVAGVEPERRNGVRGAKKISP